MNVKIILEPEYLYARQICVAIVTKITKTTDENAVSVSAAKTGYLLGVKHRNDQWARYLQSYLNTFAVVMF